MYELTWATREESYYRGIQDMSHFVPSYPLLGWRTKVPHKNAHAQASYILKVDFLRFPKLVLVKSWDPILASYIIFKFLALHKVEILNTKLDKNLSTMLFFASGLLTEKKYWASQ